MRVTVEYARDVVVLDRFVKGMHVARIPLFAIGGRLRIAGQRVASDIDMMRQDDRPPTLADMSFQVATRNAKLSSAAYLRRRLTAASVPTIRPRLTKCVPPQSHE